MQFSFGYWPLAIFCDMSGQVFCSLSFFFFCLFVIDLLVFFIYFGFQNFVRYIFCEYFFVDWLVCFFFTVSFDLKFF